MFKGTGLCLALANLSGASCVSVEGEGGFISVGFTGVGLILSSLSRSGMVLDLIGAKVEGVLPENLRTIGVTCSLENKTA